MQAAANAKFSRKLAKLVQKVLGPKAIFIVAWQLEDEAVQAVSNLEPSDGVLLMKALVEDAGVPIIDREEELPN